MLRKKKTQRVIKLTVAERRLLIHAMMRFRNKLEILHKPTEDINELLLRLL